MRFSLNSYGGKQMKDVRATEHLGLRRYADGELMLFDWLDAEDERHVVRQADIPALLIGLRILYPELFNV